jgi:hypothetical protein
MTRESTTLLAGATALVLGTAAVAGCAGLACSTGRLVAAARACRGPVSPQFPRPAAVRKGRSERRTLAGSS